MELPAFLKFASEATVIGLWGGALLLVSAIALLGERRRAKRKDVDRVGWVPWRDIGVLTLFAGLALLGFAAMGWIKA